MRTTPPIIAAGACLVLLALGLPLSARAQDNPTPAPAPAASGSTAPEAAAESGGTPASGTAPAASATAPGPDLAALARTLGAERQVLRTENGEFGVITATADAEKSTGTLLLLPADGQFPGASPGIARLRAEMPALGWATWLVELEAPPRVQSLVATGTPPPPAEGTTPPAETGKSGAPAEKAAPGDSKPAGESDAAEPPARPPETTTPEGAATGVAPAAAAVDAAVDAPGMALDKRVEEAHAAWIKGNRARVAAALVEAAKAGPVALVAEGSAAPVLAAALDRAEGLAALVLLAPVPLAEAPFAWPEKLPLPVLEVLEPGASPEARAASRERARAAGVKKHRVLLFALDGPEVGPGESLLTRRVRGWLTGLARQDGG